MAFLRNFKYKLLFSAIIAIISSLYQLETKDELKIAEKVVMLSKNRTETFEFLIKFEEYPKVMNILYTPNQSYYFILMKDLDFSTRN